MQTFSDIDSQRAAHGIRQRVLAERAGLKPQSYSKLKAPSMRGPTERTLQRLSAALAELVAEQGGKHG